MKISLDWITNAVEQHFWVSCKHCSGFWNAYKLLYYYWRLHNLVAFAGQPRWWVRDARRNKRITKYHRNRTVTTGVVSWWYVLPTNMLEKTSPQFALNIFYAVDSCGAVLLDCVASKLKLLRFISFGVLSSFDGLLSTSAEFYLYQWYEHE